jgi:hypothetical protein
MASGQIQQILGVADIKLHFVGENNCNKPFLLDVIVHKGLEQEFFLGQDFTGSDAKAIKTNDYIYHTYEQECYLDSVDKNQKNKKLCKVPLCSVREAPISISNNKTVVIPPFNLGRIHFFQIHFLPNANFTELLSKPNLSGFK